MVNIPHIGIPSSVHDVPTAPMDLPPPLVRASSVEDTASAIGAAVGRAIFRGPPGVPTWLLVLIAVLSGGASATGTRALLGPDPEVQLIAARLEVMGQRVDGHETAIAEGEISRMVEVRYLIALTTTALDRLGVPASERPDVPPELSEEHRRIEVEAQRRKMFEARKPAPVEVQP